MKTFGCALLVVAAALFAGWAAPVNAAPKKPLYSVGGLVLTKTQFAEVLSNFEVIRRCPAELDPYAINEKGGDCLGGESGSPQQTAGGG